ncbi:Hypp7352 [Branchiostoma lanceolatum]|uniref:Hypp7352 protein n=1 Tax=Branchiostoma lanceolatum TaxID=7740 RepID=A0A8K0EB11_BRALA|nr:Hypp7352 [Branchiostoma lanceolatum]
MCTAEGWRKVRWSPGDVKVNSDFHVTRPAEKRKYRAVAILGTVESSEKGRLPANRTNVLFLGDKRAGKTSLKRHLSDDGFDPEESSTIGIERELVQAEEVNEDWTELVVDLLTNLLRMPVQDGALVPLTLMEKLCMSLNAPFEEVIIILRQYDIICPILCSPEDEDTAYAKYYIIPLKLRRLDRKRKVVEVEEGILSSDPEDDDSAWLPFWQNQQTDVRFYFNFKEFNPDAVFIRLLARCLYVSQRSHDMSNRRNVYSDAGRFYLSNDFYFKIELCSPSDDQNLVQVTIGRAPESGVRELLYRIYRDIKDICSRDFPYVSYTFGIQCEACRHDTGTPEDQLGQREHPRHILNIVTHEEDFPSDDVARLLCERQVHEVDFRRWPDTIRVIEDSLLVSQSDIERGRSMEMTEAHRKLLTKNRLQLLRNVIPDDVIKYLIQDDVMSNQYAEEVRDQPTTRGRVGMVLDHLPRRSDAAFYSFKRALQRTKQKHVAKLLEE